MMMKEDMTDGRNMGKENSTDPMALIGQKRGKMENLFQPANGFPPNELSF